jgi:hypothetical protein
VTAAVPEPASGARGRRAGVSLVGPALSGVFTPSPSGKASTSTLAATTMRAPLGITIKGARPSPDRQQAPGYAEQVCAEPQTAEMEQLHEFQHPVQPGDVRGT